MEQRGIDLVGPEHGSKSAEANRRKSYQRRGVSPEYEASKFVYDAETKTYVCPQGKRLPYYAKYEQDGTMRYRYKASKQDCQTCPAKALCCPRSKHGRAIERSEPSPEVAALVCAESPKYALNLSGSPSPTISCSGFASAGGQRWYRRSRRRECIEHSSPIRLSTRYKAR